MCLNGCQMSSKRGLMYKMLILSIFALLSVGCSSSSDSSGSSSGSNISLSDIKANLAGKKYIITTESITSDSSRTNSKEKSETNTLLVIDESGNVDYGLITISILKVKYSILSPSGDYSYLLLDSL
jgi:hypothetical protein